MPKIPGPGDTIDSLAKAKEKIDSLLNQKTKLENLQFDEIKMLMQIVPINIQEPFKIQKQRGHWYGDDKILGSYISNTNIGIDFAAMKRGDTIFLKLPAVKVLNKDGKVIGKSSYPICTGGWSDQELKQMEDSANAYFLEKAKSEFPRAEQKIEELMRNAATLGLRYKEVVIEFEK